ncbi:MAG: tRNA dihydrouridine synthase DusB [Oligoflexus sp.]
MQVQAQSQRPSPWGVFQRLEISSFPIILAPLAGVSDHPFRRICQHYGADLTYVEMLSATALLYDSRRTWEMLKRHSEERRVGVQLTGRSADDVGRAVARLHDLNFDTIDINMGCPVRKVVKTGCGSAILKDPERVQATVTAARSATDRPLSAKIRLGWDRQSINGIEVAQAIEAGGADWLVVHGRTRADDYSVAVDLEEIARIKASVSIPVIGNGNIFSRADAELMREATGVDGVMVSRGALGDPWLFREIQTGERRVGLEEWLRSVLDHLGWQQEEYGNQGAGAVCMRKHLLWYAKGWPGVKQLREAINQSQTLTDARALIEEFAAGLSAQGLTHRLETGDLDQAERFNWDPKWDMDRKLDRGVGDDPSMTAEELAIDPTSR